MGLGEALSSHAYSFTAITSLPVEVVQAGDEPDLPPVARGLLFGIVHNAMTNVLRHAQASRVEVALDFQAGHLCLSVSDDGIGIPQEREGWGHGLRNMAANAQRMGGRLEGVAGSWRSRRQSNLRSPLPSKSRRCVECQRECRSE